MKTTSHMLITPLLAVAALLCLVLPLHSDTAAPALSCKVTQQVVQGGAAFLTVDAPQDTTAVTLTCHGKTVPAFRCGDHWQGVLGVSANDAPGKYAVTITATRPGGNETLNTGYLVTKRSFPIQRLRMSATMDAMYEASGVQEEYRLINAGLARETPRQWAGAFRQPAPGRISTRYGVQRYRNGKKVGIHKGLDIAAGKGTPVHAANAGTVVLVRKLTMHGHTVVIDHGGGVVGLYLHLSTFNVKEGQTVAAGDVIARVGSTGVATGPHLHYALYAHSVAIDPTLWSKVPAGF